MSRTFKKLYQNGTYRKNVVRFGWRSAYPHYFTDIEAYHYKWWNWAVTNGYKYVACNSFEEYVENERKGEERYFRRCTSGRRMTYGHCVKEHARKERRNNEREDLNKIRKDIDSYDEFSFRSDRDLRYIGWIYD